MWWLMRVLIESSDRECYESLVAPPAKLRATKTARPLVTSIGPRNKGFSRP